MKLGPRHYLLVPNSLKLLAGLWGSRDPEGQLCQDSIEEPGFEYSSSD
ncbi:hypothetical protein VULLAG_LOCUS11913 [Vulpes lagopus]